MNGRVQVILGPPGTGKTTELMRKLDEELGQGLQPDSLLFTSFTRAARDEVGRRIDDRFGLRREDLRWLATAHGIAFRLLKLDSSRVLQHEHLAEFAETYGYRFTQMGNVSVEEGLVNLPRQTDDDVLRAVFEWGRSRLLDVEATVAAAVVLVRADAFRRFVTRYSSYKRDKKLLDFNDMLEEALKRDLDPQADVAFVDEAQDLSPLQIRAVERWTASCLRVYVAGDDDQAIYGFQGADPEWLISLARQHPTVVLRQSHRVPRLVQNLALRVIGRNSHRLPKPYLPRDAEGVVDRMSLDSALRQLQPSTSTFILARNRCFLRPVAEDLQRQGVPYIVEGGGISNPLGSEVLAAARAARAVAAGQRVEAEDFRAMLDLVPSQGMNLLPWGIKKKAQDLRGTLWPSQVNQLLENGTLLKVATEQGPLAVLMKLEKQTLRYLERVDKRYGQFIDPKIVLTTVHGAKGRQADLVVLIPDMTRATYREYQDQRHGGAEAENRVAYVGATRAKESLITTLPNGPCSYPYPSVTSVTSHSGGAAAA